MHDIEILAKIKSATPYLADDGFSNRVLSSLPEPKLQRQGVIGLSWSMALLAGTCIWLSSGPTLALIAWHPAAWLCAASLAFWALLLLFAFVSFDEGMLEI